MAKADHRSSPRASLVRRRVTLAAIAALLGRELGLTIDPRKLKPREAVQVLNSTPLGEVINERKLGVHRQRAGLRIGDGKTVDLLRYTAWLAVQRHTAKPAAVATPEGDSYQRHKARVAENMRAAALLERDIGPIPAVADPERRASCERDFAKFCRIYFSQTFFLPFSPDHLKVIERIEQTVLEGGQSAIAMPRGSGKSSLCEVAILWALLYGHRRFGAVIGPDEGHATDCLESIKSELENNELLCGDFPEVCYPIVKLEHIHNRAPGQLCEGKPTKMQWKADKVVLPTVEGSQAAGAVIEVAGLTGQVRGMKYKRPDGRQVRPDLVLVDDPQTDESARSPTQCAERERILSGAILGLAGPGSRMGVLAAVTIILPGDLSDRILDRENHPEWHGETTKLVYALPSNVKLWDEYAERRRADQRANRRDYPTCTAFYREHRAEMDEGAIVAWPERFDPPELSAVQNAMNIRIDKGDPVFFAEYQNEPLRPEVGDSPVRTAEEISGKLHGLERGTVPQWAEWITGFIDISESVLFWAMTAWAKDFTGAVIDYGSWPQQPERYFNKQKLINTLRRKYEKAGLEGSILSGLQELVGRLLKREFARVDGVAMRANHIAIDTGHLPDLVRSFCRASEHAAVLMPGRGFGVTASMKPMTEYDDKRGDRVGFNWILEKAQGGVRRLRYDTNFWKSHVHSHLGVALGDPGSLSLYGHKAVEHQLIAEHLTAERPVRTYGQGREVWEWKWLPGRDNDFFDCVVGCAVLASYLGAELPGTSAVPKKKRVRWSDIQKQKRARAQTF